MTTSGTITFNETAAQICTDALSLLAVIGAGETISTNDLTFCVQALNKMLKAWQGQGIHLWTEESGTIYLVSGQAQYNLLAGATGAKASDGTGTPQNTTLALAASSGATTITLTTAVAALITANDTIGIELDTNTIFWTTVSGTPSGAVVTLASGLTSAAALGNSVFSYTTQMPRALSIQSARYRANGFDRKMEMRAREDYMNIPQKTITGSPIILYYSPQLNRGEMLIWPTADDVSGTIEVTYLRQIEDVGVTTNTLDIPQEWQEAVVYNLAVRIAPAYGFNLSSGGVGGNPDILTQARQYLEDMKAWDSEQPWIQLVRKPDYRK